MLACNAMPGVFCGLVIDPTDAFLFSQINAGNAISMPYAKGFGWAAELNLQDCYRKLFEGEPGVGYPKERAAIMAKNRSILADLKAAASHDMMSVLKNVDQDLLKAAIAGEKFEELLLSPIRRMMRSALSARPLIAARNFRGNLMTTQSIRSRPARSPSSPAPIPASGRALPWHWRRPVRMSHWSLAAMPPKRCALIEATGRDAR